jgi:hypothetical protein
MTIKVQYRNSVYDIILADTLHRLLDNRKIKKFYRYTEKRWIIVGFDHVSKGPQVLAPNAGPERHVPQTFETLFSTENSRLMVNESLLTKSENSAVQKLKR